MKELRLQGASASQVLPLAVLVAGVLGLCGLVFGGTAAVIAVGFPAALAAAAYLITRPKQTLVVMVVAEVANLMRFTEGTPLPLFEMSLGLGMVTVVVALRDPAMRGRLNRGTGYCVGLVALYLVTQMLAVLGSQNIDLSSAEFRNALAGCIFLVVVLLLAQMTEGTWTVAAAVVVPLAVMSALCLVNHVVFGGAVSFGGFATVTEASGELTTTPRYGGPGLDTNFWGRHLILGVPMACALLVRARRAGRRNVGIGWSAALIALFAGVYLTQSRGTLVATAAVLFVWVLASGPTVRRRGLISLPLVALVVLLPGIGDRFLALIADVSDSGSTHGVDPSVVGRIAAQETAWMLFNERPVFGFGPDVFDSEVPRYSGLVDTAVLVPADASHNLYAQLAAESGIVGLLGWLAFIGGFIWYIAVMAARLPAESPNADRSLAAAALAAIIGWSIASIFLHLAYFRTFAIVLALAGALAAQSSTERVTAVIERRKAMWEDLLATTFGVAAAILVLGLTTTVTHSVSQTLTVVPTSQDVDGSYAYALDIKSRDVLLRTYASLMTAGTSAVSAQADPVRGVIAMSVDTADEHSAPYDLEEALAQARSHLSHFGADSWYRVVPVGGAGWHVGATRSATATGVAVATGSLVAVFTFLSMRRRLGSETVAKKSGGSGRLRRGGRPDVEIR